MKAQTHIALTTRTAERALCGAPLTDEQPKYQVNPANPNFLDFASLALSAFGVVPCTRCQDIVETERRAACDQYHPGTGEGEPDCPNFGNAFLPGSPNFAVEGRGNF